MPGAPLQSICGHYPGEGAGGKPTREEALALNPRRWWAQREAPCLGPDAPLFPPLPHGSWGAGPLPLLLRAALSVCSSRPPGSTQGRETQQGSRGSALRGPSTLPLMLWPQKAFPPTFRGAPGPESQGISCLCAAPPQAPLSPPQPREKDSPARLPNGLDMMPDRTPRPDRPRARDRPKPRRRPRPRDPNAPAGEARRSRSAPAQSSAPPPPPPTHTAQQEGYLLRKHELEGPNKKASNR